MRKHEWGGCEAKSRGFVGDLNRLPRLALLTRNDDTSFCCHNFGGKATEVFKNILQQIKIQNLTLI